MPSGILFDEMKLTAQKRAGGGARFPEEMPRGEFAREFPNLAREVRQPAYNVPGASGWQELPTPGQQPAIDAFNGRDRLGQATILRDTPTTALAPSALQAEFRGAGLTGAEAGNAAFNAQNFMAAPQLTMQERSRRQREVMGNIAAGRQGVMANEMRATEFTRGQQAADAELGRNITLDNNKSRLAMEMVDKQAGQKQPENPIETELKREELRAKKIANDQLEKSGGAKPIDRSKAMKEFQDQLGRNLGDDANPMNVRQYWDTRYGPNASGKEPTDPLAEAAIDQANELSQQLNGKPVFDRKEADLRKEKAILGKIPPERQDYYQQAKKRLEQNPTDPTAVETMRILGVPGY